ncbi:MAG: peptidase T [Holophagaceae bacterium]|nr:peptidase T [Holophagaceae bacterium]
MPVFSLSTSEQEVLLGRFLRYVQVDTQSDDNAECFPTTEKQKNLARLLVEELKALGCDDAIMDQWGYVMATVPSNLPKEHPAVPTIGLIAHLDTYPGTSGFEVKPQVIKGFKGGDVPLPGSGDVIPVTQNPNLQRCVGHTIITSDGTTLLGADDKAGIAEILTVVGWLKDHPDYLHGKIRIGFTPDEEVGRGTEHFDVATFAADYAYTLDGSDLGEIEDETFCADSASITVTGHDVHPGYAKGKMINAVRVASHIVESLPKDRLPETTEGREPYLHPVGFNGDVGKAELKFLVRAFTEEELHEREDVLKGIVKEATDAFPGAKIELTIKESYRNMSYPISQDPNVLNYALEAVKKQGIEPSRRPIRGGTDGARLSFMGLLTPNVFAGSQTYHSTHEWVSLDWMSKAVEVTLQILNVWVEKSK